MLPVRFSVTRKVTSTSPLSSGWMSGIGSGCSKKLRFEMFWYDRISACRLKS